MISFIIHISIILLWSKTCNSDDYKDVWSKNCFFPLSIRLCSKFLPPQKVTAGEREEETP